MVKRIKVTWSKLEVVGNIIYNCCARIRLSTGPMQSVATAQTYKHAHVEVKVAE